MEGLPGDCGFTGSRTGVTAFQRVNLVRLWGLSDPVALHYGDCVGADYEAFMLGRALGLRLVCHPPLDRRWRAFTHGDADEVRRMKGFLDRDWDIVQESGYLVACPKESKRPASNRGSGTWTTVSYAEVLGRPVVVLWPDGRVDAWVDGVWMSW